MKIIVIGIGHMGMALAEKFTALGHEVIAVDSDFHRVETLKNTVSASICLNTTDESALKMLPLKDVDVVFVTFGKDFGISIQTVAILKKLHVSNIIVRATSKLHETVLRSIGINQILTPELDYANMIASQFLMGSLFKEWIKITDQLAIYKIKAPAILVGQTLEDIDLEHDFNLRLVCIEREKMNVNVIGITHKQKYVVENLNNTTTIEDNDILNLFGNNDDILKLTKI